MFKKRTLAVLVPAALSILAAAGDVAAQTITTGPSSSQSPYNLPLLPGNNITSIMTTGDTFGGYTMVGIPDGLGAYDNGDDTMTVLMNHELGNGVGITRAHGAIGAFVSEWVINKSTLQVVSGSDLIRNVYNWNTGLQQSNTTTSAIAFNRFCSADLPALTAFYNPNTGLGSQAKIFMNGEEGGATGYALANVASGSDKGNTYVLGKFNTATNGSGGTAVGGWENLLANPYAQDKTIVIGNNDGGTGVMSNSLAVYVGTKTNSGTEADKAGLTNGTVKFVNVTGNAAEITNTTTQATGITSGTNFTLSDTASTTFARPEDGAWDPKDPTKFYFVTTNRLDTTDTASGTTIGATRLWRLSFSDVTNPNAGGKIDLLLDGSALPSGPGSTTRPNMFDNISVNDDGTITLLEDTGNASHNGKMWLYKISDGSLTLLAKSDPARFGDLAAGTGVFTAGSQTQDEETSGVIDVSSMYNDGQKHLLFVMQNHKLAGTPDPLGLVEGGQLQMLTAPVPEPSTYALMGVGIGLVGLGLRRRRGQEGLKRVG